MDKEQVISFMKEIIKEIFIEDDANLDITNNMTLFGSDSALDSMKLVELCLALEDKASEIGFEFDWTSENAMSKSRSIFKSIESLAEEFVNQQKRKKE